MANKSTANTNKRYFYLQIGDEFLNDAVTRAIEKNWAGTDSRCMKGSFSSQYNMGMKEKYFILEQKTRYKKRSRILPGIL